MVDRTVTDAETAGRPAWWWAPPLLGVLSVVAGVVVLVRPHNSLVTLAVVSGIFMVLDSVFELATSLRHDTDARAFSAIVGVLGIIAGILLIRHPVESVTAVALIIGIWLTGAGALRGAAALVNRSGAGTVVLGGVEMVAGIVLVSSPGIGITTLAWLAGLSFVLNGLVLIATGWLARNAALGAAPTVPEPSAIGLSAS